MPSMPQKAADRLAGLAVELVAQIDREVAGGREPPLGATPLSRGAPADAVLGRVFREHREYGSRDRRFLSNAVFSFFRWHGWISSLPLPQAVAAACLLDTDDEPGLSLETLIRQSGIKVGPGGSPGRLSLEEKGKLAAQWLGQPEPLTAESLVPDGFPETLFESAKNLAPCIRSFQERPPTWLRIEPGAEAEVVSALAATKIEAKRDARIASAFSIAGSSALRSLPAEVRGRFQVQDLASQCVGLVCDPKPGERWLDACAGSGGKTLHLASLMTLRTGSDPGRGRGQTPSSITACDIRAGALEELARRVRETGAKGIRTVQLAADGPLPEGSFDGVLVDAPCSGIGTWSRNPDARWRTSRQRVDELASLQSQLLAKAAGRVRPGGVLVYAVCTVTAKETRGVIEPFLREHPGFRLDPRRDPLTGTPTDGTFWTWPWQGPCDGMFSARMRRET